MRQCKLPPATDQSARSPPRGSVFRGYFEQWKRASLGSFKGISDERHDLKGDIKERGRQLAELVARSVAGEAEGWISWTSQGLRALTLPGPTRFLGTPSQLSRPGSSAPSFVKPSWAPNRVEVTPPACVPHCLRSVNHIVVLRTQDHSSARVPTKPGAS